MFSGPAADAWSPVRTLLDEALWRLVETSSFCTTASRHAIRLETDFQGLKDQSGRLTAALAPVSQLLSKGVLPAAALVSRSTTEASLSKWHYHATPDFIQWVEDQASHAGEGQTGWQFVCADPAKGKLWMTMTGSTPSGRCQEDWLSSEGRRSAGQGRQDQDLGSPEASQPAVHHP